MKLYYAPGACSLSPHIALCEAKADFTLEKTDLRSHKTADERDYYAINPKGSVPALDIGEGQILTEGPAIVQWIADRFPAAKLAPANGSLARTRLQEDLNFINSEIHKAFGPLFRNAPQDAQDGAKKILGARLALLEQRLSDGRHFLAGSDYSVADIYLFVVMRWLTRFGMDANAWPSLAAHHKRIAERPAVKLAMKAEES